jgi:hypothetical protein
MSAAAKPNRFAKSFLAHKALREAPELSPQPLAAPAMPSSGPDAPMAAASAEIAATGRPALQLLRQGEEARLGKRKNKKIKGLIRGGRNSPEWPAAVEHLGAKVPDGFSQLVAELALNHRLHKWQVLVEAVDCFIKKHGQRASEKTGA